MEEEKFVWICSEGIGNGNEKKGMVDCANGIRKGPWTYEEDIQLVSYINFYGEGRWAALAKISGLKRTGKSCRMRWVNYLRPDLKRGRITQEEECLIIDLHRRLGNRWSRIAQSLPGRTDNEIKNYFRSHIRKKLRTTYDQGSCNHKENGGERLKSGGCILQEAEEAAAARSIIDIDGNLTPSSSSSSSSFKQSPKTQDGSEMLGITNMNKGHNKNNNKGKRLISYGFAWMSCIADSVYDCFEQGFHCGKAVSMDTTSVDCCESAAAAAAQGDSHCGTFIDYSDELWNMNYKDRLYLHS